jgi:putative glycosyltransferase (TIGR04372 family)
VRAIFKKLLSVIRKIIGLPFVIIIVLLSPFVVIRFGLIRSDRIGHFVSDVEAYLCIQDTKSFQRKEIHLIGCPGPTSNTQIFAMWRRAFRIMPFYRIWSLLDESCRFWTRSKRYHLQLAELINDFYLIPTGKQHLFFAKKELELGKDILQKLGIPIGAPWVCFHNRDPSYIDLTWKTRKSYHDYRNFTISSMRDAAEELTRRGYYVVRMGSVADEPFSTSNYKIIDYSFSSLRSDFMDVFLLANCFAHIGSDSGIADIPYSFRRPISYVNFSSTLIEIILKRKLAYPFLIKRLRNKATGKLISLQQMYDLGLENACRTQDFEMAGVEVVDNTSDEIRDLAIEMIERINGNWVVNAEDKDLQSCFWAVVEKSTGSRIKAVNVSSYIGTSFLKKHLDLLG